MAQKQDNAGRFIEKIRLQNFQSYKDTSISLTSGINLITGSSDAGKTAILRALNFVLHNEWSPDFLRIGTTDCTVSIKFSDGITVQRIKGVDTNSVIVWYPAGHPDYPDGYKDPHHHFGVKYPPDVLKALGNPPVDERHGALSFGEQNAPLFLVSLTPTELPRSISELTGIDDFDDAAQLLSSKAKKSDKSAKESSARITRHEADLTAYKGLDDQLAVADKLESRKNRVDDAIEEIQAGERLIERYQDVMLQGKEATRALKAAQKITVFHDRLVDMKQQTAEFENMEEMIARYKSLNDTVSNANAALNKALKIASPNFTTRLAELKSSMADLAEARKFEVEYTDLIAEAKGVKSECDKWSDSLAAKRKKFDELKKSMKDKGLWCPACDRPLVEDAC